MYTLNESQLKACNNIEGPLIVSAGPGTGKTFLVIEKIKYLIKKGVKENEILAITFSRKAAEEIKDRLSDSLGFFHNVQIFTFHSFAENIIRKYHANLNLNEDFILMDKMQSIVFLEDHIFDFELNVIRPVSNPYKDVEKLLNLFSKFEDNFISPEEILNKEFKSEEERECAYLYKKYFELKIQESKLEFNDLIFLCLKLFNEDNNVLKQVKDSYKYILVDEFQDTNHIQNLLINKIVNDEHNITIVGDINQSIYNFRGANLNNINEFKKTFSNYKEINLDTNYRSHQEIVDSAYKIIKGNPLKSSKGNGGEIIDVFRFNTGDKELDFIASQVIKLRDTEKKEFKDFAILTRSNALASEVSLVLQKYNIPFEFRGSDSFSNSSEVKDLISITKFFEDQNNDISLLRIMGLKIFDIDILSRYLISKISKISKISIFRTLNVIFDTNDTLSDTLLVNSPVESIKYSNTIYDIPSFIKEIKSSNIKDFYVLLSKYILPIEGISFYNKILEFLSEIKYFEYVHSLPDGTFVRGNVDKFMSIIQKLEDIKITKFSRYLDHINKVSFEDDVDILSNLNAVTLSTVHGVKGMEFPVVFMPFLTSDRFPSRQLSRSAELFKDIDHDVITDGDIDEEKRLFFVGVTRAKEKIFLTYSDFYENNKKQKNISPFILDLGLKEKIVDYHDKDISIILNTRPLEYFIPKDYERFHYSYSKIVSFRKCPLHYYYEYVLNFPKKQSYALEYGTLIHNTINQFFRIKNFKDIDLLNSIYLKNWESINLSVFKNLNHSEIFKQYGLENLKKHIDMVTPKSKYFYNEMNFRFKFENKYTINGRIDRIDFFDDGSISIVDYKTGSSKNQDSILNNLQLYIYALAAKDKYKKDIKDLSLIFIDEGNVVKSSYKDLDLEKVDKELIELMTKMDNIQNTISKTFWCESCEYNIL